MAQVSISKALAVMIVVFAVVFPAVSAQVAAPAPSPDAGAGFSLPVSGAVVGLSLLVSFLGLLKH
ncbi:hypothetical protein JCGZ_06806 [Jatropha curcas]|uniref:Uncharacterized protein n=1 Tax=Jatropha curcas TaxID=180498 RepID=A0A067KMK7_JATCU|nr:hypothetical protein JCGZ_06806 [Jatropha curcas]